VTWWDHRAHSQPGVQSIVANVISVDVADVSDETLTRIVNEQWLFHASCRDALASICARGFDVRLSQHDRRFGQVPLQARLMTAAASFDGNRGRQRMQLCVNLLTDVDGCRDCTSLIPRPRPLASRIVPWRRTWPAMLPQPATSCQRYQR
jgi:hypothetical protein